MDHDGASASRRGPGEGLVLRRRGKGRRPVKNTGLRYPLPTAYYPLPTAYCLLPTAYCLLPCFYRGTPFIE